MNNQEHAIKLQENSLHTEQDDQMNEIIEFLKDIINNN